MSLSVALPDFLTRHADGQVKVVGTRVVLYHFVYDYNQGLSAEQLALQFPTIPLATVHKLIAFYLENRAEVDRYAVEYAARAAELAKSIPEVNTAALRERLAQTRPAGVA
jgi:uncharacterized protein (DUF433 family)